MRRVKFYFVILLLSSFFVLSNTKAKILISKVQIAGTSTPTNEFIELYNYSTSTISLSDWGLKKLTSSGSEYNLVSNFPSSTVLNPFSYFLVAHQDFLCDGISADLTYSNSSYSLANNNSLVLLDSAGLLINRLDWGTVSGTPIQNPAPGFSLVRLPNDTSGNHIDTGNSNEDFIEIETAPFNSLSPARPLSFLTEQVILPTTTPTSTEEEPNVGGFPDLSLWNFLRINEIMTNPATGTEWVELYNSATTSIDLSGGTLCDSRADTCTISILEGAVEPLNWSTVFLSGSKLNNDGDSVYLKNPDGAIIDEITYGNGSPTPDKGQSLARKSDGIDTDTIDDWAITTNPTGGSSNIIISPPSPPPSYAYGGGGSIETPKQSATKIATSTKDITTIAWKLIIPTVIESGSSTLFDSHLSSDPRGGEVLFTWNFGDGTFAEGSKIIHDYLTPGIYEVIVSATSTKGTLGSKKVNIKVYAKEQIPEGIFIQAISPSPVESDEEMVAVKNNSTTTIDLSGWKIATENNYYVVPPTTFITPDETLRFFRTATKLVLNNERGTVYLYSKENKIIDLVAYDKGNKGQTYNLSEGGWGWLPRENETKTTSSKKVSAPNTKFYRTVEIADARNTPLGSLVILNGTVESLPGSPGLNYFYINDGTGGIQVYSYKKDFPNLSLGDVVKVMGEISASQGVVRIKTSSKKSIAFISKGFSKENPKSLEEVDENDFGTLVSLQGEITETKSSHFYLDDGNQETIVSLSSRLGIDKTSLSEGSSVLVTGIVEKNANGWRLHPRTSEDIKIFKNESLSPESNTREPVSTAKIIWGTGLGFFLMGLAMLLRKKFI